MYGMNFLKSNFKWIAVILGFSAISACTKSVEEVGGCQFPSDEDLRLVWSDEFDDLQLNIEKWSFDTADGCQIGICNWGNNERQYYTSREENVFLEDGKLVIRARKEIPSYEGYSYTSARLKTKYKGDWKYGKFEIRARLPYGQGIWPAIWMLSTDNAYGPWPTSGEIDIMENIGSEPNNVFGTVHYGHDQHRYYTQELDIDSINFSQGFHTYSAIWTEQCIQFYVDGKEMGSPVTRSTVLPSTYPFDQRFYLILNVAVGGNLPGDPNATTQFPQTMEVEYVRVYQEN